MRVNPRTEQPSALQQRLAARIVDDARATAGASLSNQTEFGLARALGVSRTPVRGALEWLRSQGVLQCTETGAWQLTPAARRRRTAHVPAPPPQETDRIFVAIARDRLEDRLPAEVTEADLMRRYASPRATVTKVLSRLAEVGLVERKRGHGWRFLAVAHDRAARDESYACRLLIEPAALLTSAFKIAPQWLADMRERHQAMLAHTWSEARSVALFDLNADFHEGLASASGNRFFQMAIEQQNRLRRFVNVHWTFGPERVQISCREHLEILDRVAVGDHDVAAALMRRHLEQARRL